MYQTKLPYDISRCYGSSCSQRESCLRFVAIESDKLIGEPCRIGYSDNMCYHHDGEETMEFEGGYKITLEKLNEN